MDFVKYCFLLLCLSISGVFLNEMSDEFNNANICSDLKIEPPQKLLRISYGDTDMKLGESKRSSQVSNEPDMTFDILPGHYYSLFMLDPDEPGPGQYLYWLVANMESSDVKSVNHNAPYERPDTTSGVGMEPHRYVFLLYEHQKKIKVPRRFKGRQRRSFFISDFAKYNENIGILKFGNYFRGVNDEDSDEDSSEIV